MGSEWAYNYTVRTIGRTLLSSNCCFHILPGIETGSGTEQMFLILIERWWWCQFGDDGVFIVGKVLLTALWRL